MAGRGPARERALNATKWWLVAFAGAVVVAGLVGIAIHAPHRPVAAGGAAAHRPKPPAGATTTTATTVATSVSSTTAGSGGGPPGASSARLAANLLDPTDLGGYYHVVPDDGAAFLASAPCLAGLSPSAAQSGRAVTALLGPDLGSLPEIVEAVVSYPGASSVRVYEALSTTMQGCTTFSAAIGGTDVHVPLSAGQMPSLGQGSSLYQGQFLDAGRTLQLSIGFAADNGDLVLIAYLDTRTPSGAIFGGAVSTLSAAIGKEA